MIIYNKTWLHNLSLHNEAEQLHKAHLITSAELDKVKKTYPVGFYSPGIFVRVGLFVLTVVIISAVGLLIGQLIADAHVNSRKFLSLLLGITGIITLDVLVKKRNYFRAGVDDALLWLSSTLLYYWADDMLYRNNHHSLILSVIVLLASIALTLRYLDIAMCVVSCLSFFAVIFFSWQKITFGNDTMSFMMILAAGLVYWASIKTAAKIRQPYYNNCLVMVQTISLIVFYAADNYYVVDNLNQELNGIGAILSLKPFFWCWTMVIPPAYLAYGLIKKNVLMTRIGLVLNFAALYTFRTYVHVMSLEMALTLAGAVLLVIIYVVIQYLKTPKHGYTYANIENTTDSLNAEGLFTAATLTVAHRAEPDSKFGGGDFGGGGSGGKFE